jgi:hypothetical protein
MNLSEQTEIASIIHMIDPRFEVSKILENRRLHKGPTIWAQKRKRQKWRRRENRILNALGAPSLSFTGRRKKRLTPGEKEDKRSERIELATSRFMEREEGKGEGEGEGEGEDEGEVEYVGGRRVIEIDEEAERERQRQAIREEGRAAVWRAREAQRTERDAMETKIRRVGTYRRLGENALELKPDSFWSFTTNPPPKGFSYACMKTSIMCYYLSQFDDYTIRQRETHDDPLFMLVNDVFTFSPTAYLEIFNEARPEPFRSATPYFSYKALWNNANDQTTLPISHKSCLPFQEQKMQTFARVLGNYLSERVNRNLVAQAREAERENREEEKQLAPVELSTPPGPPAIPYAPPDSSDIVPEEEVMGDLQQILLQGDDSETKRNHEELRRHINHVSHLWVEFQRLINQPRDANNIAILTQLYENIRDMWNTAATFAFQASVQPYGNLYEAIKSNVMSNDRPHPIYALAQAYASRPVDEDPFGSFRVGEQTIRLGSWIMSIIERADAKSREILDL